jgi:hypothetical protein
MRAIRLLCSALALTALAAASATAAPVAGAQFRYWTFTDDNIMRDELVYVAPGPFHVQLEKWDFARGKDQFRPEVGLHLRDARRSVYTVQWRHERDDERWTLGTEQILAKGWVGRAEVSPLVFSNRTEIVYDAGADYYWGSYHFASATLIRDPREGGLWVLPVRLRLATEANDWLQFTLAPASKLSIAWAADAKWRIVRAGVERNSRFDFTELDNVIFTAGLEVPLPAPH